MSKGILKKGPAVILEFSGQRLNLSTHSGSGLIYSNIPSDLEKWLHCYVNDQDLPILQGFCLNRFSPFTTAVFKEIMKIQKGEVKTYAEIAKRLCKPGAARAVGNSCAKNPYLLVIPCHRVVGKEGIGGFSAGLEIKKKLLSFELGTLFAP